MGAGVIGAGVSCWSVGVPWHAPFWQQLPLEVVGFDIRKLGKCLAVRSPHPHLPVISGKSTYII